MAHDVKLGLWSVITPFNTTPASSAIDTTASGYDLITLNLVTPTGDPLTDHVIETMTVRISGTSKADLRTKLSAVYDFAEQVQRFVKGENPNFGRVMLRVENTGNAYWSTLHNVQVAHNDILGGTYANYQVEVTVTYERDGFWERAISASAITLSNSNGTGTALNIANCNDGTGTAPNKLANYVELDINDVDGDVATPAYLYVYNSENSGYGDETIYAGGIITNKVRPTLFLEAEAASGGTNTADATCSGGYNESIVLASGTEVKLTWTLTNPERYLGQWYKCIGRLVEGFTSSAVMAVNFQWRVLSNSVEIWRGPWFRINNTVRTSPTLLCLVQEFCEMPLPPLSNMTGTMRIVLACVQSTGASISFSLDYIQLMAANCFIKATGFQPVEYSDAVYVPEPNSIRLVPMHVDTTNYYDWYTVYAKTLMLYPGIPQTIHFVIQAEDSLKAEKDRNSTISIYYRPRYRSIGE